MLFVAAVIAPCQTSKPPLIQEIGVVANDSRYPIRGSWKDEQSGQTVGPNYVVRSNSRLVRVRDLTDEDRLFILPSVGVKGGRPDLIEFSCKRGVTCVGPLDLTKVMVAIAGDTPSSTFAAFRKSVSGQAVRHLTSLISRSGGEELTDGVYLVEPNSAFDPRRLFARPPSTGREFWIEFCQAEVGKTCGESPQPIKWQAPAANGPGTTIRVSPGFYKIVIDQPYKETFQRTDDQAYALLIGDSGTFLQVASEYAAAQRLTNQSYDANSSSVLLLYLQSLAGPFTKSGRK